MKRPAIIAVVIVVVGGFILLFNSAYTVAEWEQVVITQFGKPVGDPITEPGLHFKTPFVQKKTTFEKRIMEWDGRPSEILTSDKENLMVNTVARWKIVDPLRFYQTLRTHDRGMGVLGENIGNAVQQNIKTHALMEVLRSTQRELTYTTAELKKAEEEKNIVIEIGRTKVAAKIHEMAGAGLIEQYGIKLIDVRIRQIHYAEGVIQKIYDRMRSERRRIKDRYESEGTEGKLKIEGEVERDKAKLESEGYRESKQITGEADAKALKIYAEAYQKDPEFYSFIKTLETYEKTFGKDTHLILSTDSEFYRYLKDFMPPR